MSESSSDRILEILISELPQNQSFEQQLLKYAFNDSC